MASITPRFIDIIPSGLKKRKVVLFADSDTSDGLRVSQVPESPKVSIFVPTKPAGDRPITLLRSLSSVKGLAGETIYSAHTRRDDSS